MNWASCGEQVTTRVTRGGGNQPRSVRLKLVGYFFRDARSDAWLPSSPT